MRIAVVGSRGWKNRSVIWLWLEKNISPGDVILSGGAEGADSIAASWARLHGIALHEILPDYEHYSGKLAPLVRNAEIAANCDRLVAFWDGFSRGTMDAVRKAGRLGKPHEIVTSTFSHQDDREILP